MYLKFIEEYLIHGRYFINISYYCFPPCLPINLLLKTMFHINAVELLSYGKYRIRWQCILDRNRKILFSFLFPKVIFCRASFFKPTLLLKKSIKVVVIRQPKYMEEGICFLSPVPNQTLSPGCAIHCHRNYHDKVIWNKLS